MAFDPFAVISGAIDSYPAELGARAQRNEFYRSFMYSTWASLSVGMILCEGELYGRVYFALAKFSTVSSTAV
jgi:hypothetical protein